MAALCQLRRVWCRLPIPTSLKPQGHLWRALSTSRAFQRTQSKASRSMVHLKSLSLSRARRAVTHSPSPLLPRDSLVCCIFRCASPGEEGSQVLPGQGGLPRLPRLRKVRRADACAVKSPLLLYIKLADCGNAASLCRSHHQQCSPLPPSLSTNSA